MNLFVDCGAHKGKISEHWLRHHNNYRAVLFEPHPDIPIKATSRMTVFREAVWTSNGSMYLYLDRKGRLDRSSLFPDKKGIGKIPMLVKTRDLAEYIYDQSKAFQHITMKMDIEGAEYEVLEHLLSTDTIKHVGDLYIEWHWYNTRMGMGRLERKQRHKALLAALGTIPTLRLHDEYYHVFGLPIPR